MRNETVQCFGSRRVILMDSISLIGPEDEGSVVVCGSHGGRISGAFALRHPPSFVFFNDAGGGRNAAGIAALPLLDEAGIGAASISHVSARIGEALDAWENGILSDCNGVAEGLGVRPGLTIREAVDILSAKVA